MTQPDDRELGQYLEGGSKLSRRYREASAESSPPDLDEAILAHARAELRRKPSPTRLLAPLAVAASLLLGVNLAWHVYQDAPAPELQQSDRSLLHEQPPAAPVLRAEAPPAEPAPQPERKQRAAAPAAPELDAIEVTGSRVAGDYDEDRQAARAESEERAARREELAESQRRDAPAPSEPQKIDRLIGYVRTLPDAVFIRNGQEHTPEEAALHMQLKRKKAGKLVKTADDFIRLCASHSSTSGEAYLIRFADGRTRTAEDVLREELARINDSTQ